MKNIKLNLNLVFGNEDLPKDKNFNDEFRMLRGNILKYVGDLILLQTAVPDAVASLSCLDNFMTSNQSSQSFQVAIEITEKTFFSIRVKGTIMDSKGTIYTVTKDEKNGSIAPVWFGGFEVINVPTVKVDINKPTVIRLNQEFFPQFPGPSKEVKSSTDIAAIQTEVKNTTIQDKQVNQTHDSNTKQYQQLIEEVCDAAERYSISDEDISEHLSIPIQKAQILTGKVAFSDVTEMFEVLEHIQRFKDDLSIIVEKVKKKKTSKVSLGSEFKAPLVNISVEKDPPELIRKKAFVENAYRYIKLINEALTSEASYKMLHFAGVSYMFKSASLTEADYAENDEQFFIKQLELIRKVHTQVKEMKDKEELAKNDPRVQMRAKLREIFDHYQNMTVANCVKILGITQSYYYRFKSEPYDTFTVENYTRHFNNIEKAHKVHLQEALAKEMQKIREARPVVVKEVKVEKTTPLKIFAEIRAVMLAMNIGNKDISNITGVDITTVEAILKNHTEKVKVNDLETIKELTYIGVKTLEEQRSINKVQKVTDLNEIKQLDGLIKKSIHPTGVTIVKFNKELYKQADSELAARYGANAKATNTKMVSKYFNDNRKKLLTISKNSVEIANLTGIDSTVIHRSMKHGAMIPGRDIYAVHLYLESITTELEAIRNTEVCQ